MTESGKPEENPESPKGPAGESPRTWDRVHALFHEALDLEPEARDELLRRTAEADPALAAQVRSLLASHEESGDFLDTPAAAPFLGAAAPGDRIGPYRVIEEIGRGGMGVVFRAVRDDEHFSKEVAIKLIEPGMRSEGILKRFRAERQILAMLDHPHIARLIDGGSAPDGSPYLVMEHVTGKPLLQYCDERKLGVDERLELFLEVCDAVQFAHQRLVVHRDLKSDNILVMDDGSPRLLDFGIAKLTSPEDEGRPVTLTAPMQRMMTPDYASPEQVRGDPVTVAGDVYSLGVILYELMTGTRPLHFATRTPEEIARVVAQEEPALPSSAVARAKTTETAALRKATTRALRRRLSGDLDYIILKSLEKDLSRRYATVDQFARDLRRYREGRPVLARGRTTAYLLSRLVRRHRVAVITGGLVAASLVAGLVATAWQARVAGLERDRAKRRFEEVRALAHAVVFDIHDAIVNLPGSTKARETLVFHALRYLDSLSKEASGDYSLQHELAVAYGKIGDVQGRPMFPNLGRSADALRSYERSLALLQSAAAACPDSLDFSRDLVVTMQRLGDLLGRMGKPDEAMKMESDAKRRVLAERARHPENVLLQGDFLVACDRLSDLKFAAGDTLGAVKELKESLSVVEPIYFKDPQDPGGRRGIMVASAKLANLLAKIGERDSAATYYRRAEALAVEAAASLPNNTEASRDLGIVYGMRALFMADGGDIDSALVAYARGMRIAEDLAAADTSDVLQKADVAHGHFEMGTLLMKARRYQEAEARSSESYRRYGGLAARDSGNAETRMFMARASRQAGEACQALATRSGTPAERLRWRSKGLEWFERSRSLYRALGVAGALNGHEVNAEAEVSRLLETLRETS
ncbi:MAG TPA: serine/threonine-protein kinase [Candidatus Eisenbacteria bacterium]|nr:serine/threonine-protein kinase [Candidatus Eisenbacteria bacterium]